MKDERQDGGDGGTGRRGDKRCGGSLTSSRRPVSASPRHYFTLHPSYFIPAYGCPMPKPKLSPPPPPPKPPGPRPPPPPGRRDIIATSGSMFETSCMAVTRVGSAPTVLETMTIWPGFNSVSVTGGRRSSICCMKSAPPPRRWPPPPGPWP